MLRSSPSPGASRGPCRRAPWLALALSTAFAASTFSFASLASAQAVKADFDSGMLTPLVDLGNPATNTITPLFGGVLNVSLSPAAGSTLLADVTSLYQDMLASVDLLDWAEGLDQRVSILLLSQTMAPPTPAFDGYALELDLVSGQFDLLKIDDDVRTVVASATATLDSLSTDYRMVFRRNGTLLTGQLIDLKDISNFAASVSFDDVAGLSGFSSGFPGVAIAGDPLLVTGADVTIDNFLAAAAPGSDSDADGLGDPDDSCLVVQNGPSVLSNQVDSDGDGYGNACDPDYSGDGVVSLVDGAFLIGQAATFADGTNLQFDADGDRAITLADFALLYRAFIGGQTAPGP